MTTSAEQSKKMRLRYAGTCRSCQAPLPAKEWAFYYKDSKTVSCLPCAPEPSDQVDEAPTALMPAESAAPVVEEPVAPLDYAEGLAGASAREEFERRRDARAKRVRERFPRAGGLLLTVFDDPQSTKAWDVGAIGEEKLGVGLNNMAGPTVRVLHDRRIPKSRANIDHIVISANGVYVIDAKRYKGRPKLAIEGGLFRPRTERLVVGRRDCTKLVDGVLKQVGVVTDVLASFDVPVSGVLCFIDADWPLFGGAFETKGVAVLWPRRLRNVLAQPGPMGEDEIDRIHRALRDALPSA